MSPTPLTWPRQRWHGASTSPPTSSGGDHRSWWVGDGHVLRCTPDGDAGERLRREVRLREVRACRALELPRARSLLTGPDASALVRASASHSPRLLLLHGDLKGEHLLVDDGRLSGVLDWADAGTGPARLDVEGLLVAVGAEHALAAAAAAGVEPVEAELGALLARCRTTLRLAAFRRGEPSGPGPLLARQWRLAWEGTSVQDDGVH